MSKTKSMQRSTNLTCQECLKHFKTKGSLNTHMRSHCPEQFLLQCPDCQFTSFQKSNLVKHVAVMHRKNLEGDLIQEDAFYSCSHCDFKSATEYQLKNHTARKHATSKQWSCGECSYTTIEKAALAKHVRTHSLERPYRCEICSFSFSTASSIARHRRSHSKVKPFKCPVLSCQKEYADKKRWKEHLVTHNTQSHCNIMKQFSCPSCKYSTNRSDNLNTHIRRNHVDSHLVQLHFSSLPTSSSLNPEQTL